MSKYFFDLFPNYKMQKEFMSNLFINEITNKYTKNNLLKIYT